MKAAIGITCLLLAACLVSASVPVPAQPAQDEKQESEKFSAPAYMPTGAGRAMIGAGARLNVDLFVKSYTSDEEHGQWRERFIEGGPDGLLKALEKAKS